MDAKAESLLIMLVIGYALGVTVIASFSRGRSQGTVIVAPDPVATQESGIGCAFLEILGIIFLILLLIM